MKKHRSPHIPILIACIVLLFSLLPRFSLSSESPDRAASAAAPSGHPRETVRVGFFSFDGYHIIDDTGRRSGYGYEFLQLMSLYTNWHYEYIGYEKSWSEMLQMLQDGQIDLLTSAQKTPERETEFAFSKRPIGTSSLLLTTRSGDDRFISDEFDTYQNMRVGLLENNSRNDEFADFAAEKGFSYTPVYFKTVDELVQALQYTDTIDAIVTSSLRTIKNEWILNQFNPKPFYAIVRKDNLHLLEEINDTLAQLDIYSPEWRSDLYKKYYTLDTAQSIAFSSEERDYLKQLKANAVVFHVIMNPEAAPYSYFDEQGNPQGILPKIFAEIAHRANISYQILPAGSQLEYQALRASDDADIDLNAYFDYSTAENRGYELTRPYLSTFLAQLTKKENTKDPQSIAVPNSQIPALLAGSGIFAYKEIHVLASPAECIEAVTNNKYDAACLFTYSAQKFQREDKKSQLRINSLPQTDIGLSLGISTHTDYRLLSILNKSVESIRDSALPQQVILEYLANIPQPKFSLERYFYANPQTAALIILLIVLLLVGVFLSAVRARTARRDHLRRMELERFVGYVCSANDLVLEIDLRNKHCLRYQRKEHSVQRQTIPYDPAGYLASVHPEDQPPLENLFTSSGMQELIDRQDSSYYECRLKQPDGSWRWYSHNLHAIPRTQLHPNSLILFRKDIDSAKKAEAEKRQVLHDALENARHASAAKGNFLSRMSHEIRTPLNAIIGYLTLAQLPETTLSKIQHCLQSSSTAATHLLHIINDVLDISAIESGRFKIAQEPFHLKQQLTPLTTLFYNQAQEKSITFTTTLHNVDEEWLLGDHLRIKQILMNLLSNAIKFTPAGGTVDLSLEETSPRPNQILLKFTVTDTGIGMSESFLSRIFIPFEQESAHTAQAFGGTGLGLSIAQNLVTLMHGSIEVTSQIGKGSAFTVSLPFATVPDQEKPETTNLDSLPSTFSHIHALVIDDKSNECDYIISLLQHCRVNSEAVQSGEEGIQKIQAAEGTDKAFDFCIIDWKMPGLDGLETTRRIQAACEREIPIIVVTAYDTNEIEEAALAAGAKKVIAKPLFPSSMFDLLMTYFGNKNFLQRPQRPVRDRLSDIHILLVEDNEMNREIAVALLEESGLTIDTAIDGKDALRKFTSSAPGTYQCIFMDIQMPVMNGYEATRAIRRSTHPEAASIPIIAVTADVFAEDVARALACGMNDYISKPIDYDKLIHALLKFVKA